MRRVATIAIAAPSAATAETVAIVAETADRAAAAATEIADPPVRLRHRLRRRRDFSLRLIQPRVEGGRVGGDSDS